MSVTAEAVNSALLHSLWQDAIVGLLLGAVLMFVWRSVNPVFFQGETLRHDTPSLVE